MNAKWIFAGLAHLITPFRLRSVSIETESAGYVKMQQSARRIIWEHHGRLKSFIFAFTSARYLWVSNVYVKVSLENARARACAYTHTCIWIHKMYSNDSNTHTHTSDAPTEICNTCSNTFVQHCLCYFRFLGNVQRRSLLGKFQFRELRRPDSAFRGSRRMKLRSRGRTRMMNIVTLELRKSVKPAISQFPMCARHAYTLFASRARRDSTIISTTNYN